MVDFDTCESAVRFWRLQSRVSTGDRPLPAKARDTLALWLEFDLNADVDQVGHPVVFGLEQAERETERGDASPLVRARRMLFCVFIRKVTGTVSVSVGCAHGSAAGVRRFAVFCGLRFVSGAPFESAGHLRGV